MSSCRASSRPSSANCSSSSPARSARTTCAIRPRTARSSRGCGAHSGSDRMIRLAVRAPADEAEAELAVLLELAPARGEQVGGHGFVGDALYWAPGELPALP